MKADYYRYIAEFSAEDAKAKAAEAARQAWEEASNVAEKDLAGREGWGRGRGRRSRQAERGKTTTGKMPTKKQPEIF